MVIVLQVALCSQTGDDDLGLAVMERLTPEARLRTFDAISWFKANPDWDRVSYAGRTDDHEDSLPKIVHRWEEYPNALGSEAQAAMIVGRVATALGEEVPSEVQIALKTLALRGTMRDIAKAIGREDVHHRPGLSFHDVVDAGAAASGLSWTEALASITRYCRDGLRRLA
jgi:hypothetical protein